MKKLSVIVPVYNVEQYLCQCIESILNQSLKEIELILVDDGSTDSSGQICDKYAEKDQRVKVLHQENMGLLEARRSGLLKSTCSYVTFADADDFVAPVSYVLAEKSMQDDIDIIIFGKIMYFNGQYQREEKCRQLEGVYNRGEIEKTIWPDMIWNCKQEKFGIDPSLCNKVIKRNIVEKIYKKVVGYNFYYGEDSAIIFPALKQVQSLEIKAQSYYYHRQRERSTIAPYIGDGKYFDKLYALYCFLKTEFQDNAILLKQVEFFYIYSVNLRKRVYGNSVESNKYLFPFDKVKLGEHIVIYGAGTVGQHYMAQLRQLNYCEVVLWVDRNSKNFDSALVSPIEAIQTTEFDKIVIAVENQHTKKAIENDLIRMGVERARIIT